MRRRLFLLAAVLVLAAPVQASDYVLYEAVTVADTAIGITTTVVSPAGQPQMNACLVKVITAQVNVTWDGTTPTSLIGVPLDPGDWISFDNHADASRARFIRTTASSGGLRVHCWR